MHYFSKIILSTFTLFTSLSAEENALHFFYIRHGEVPGNDPAPAKYIYTGSSTDEALTEKGQRQAQECAKRISALQNSGSIERISAIYASELKRAVQTAEPIAKALGLDLHFRPDLREIYWGCADGQLVQKMSEQWDHIEDEVEQLYSDRKVRWDHLPVFDGAETFNALLKRTLKELTHLFESHSGETILIVGHGRVLKTLIAHTRDAEGHIPYPPNCGIAEFIFSPDEGLRFIKIVE